ncbi:hypothetical protein GV794_03385, partial [Nocardia cyriacigeorgica]|nr:hypothetical protein [Nocardia cyriacigeorgica]
VLVRFAEGPRAGVTFQVFWKDHTHQELIEHVAKELSAHKRPREVRIVESLPRNAMGKVQKKRLS